MWSLLYLWGCSGPKSKPCGSETASVAYVKDLGKPNLDLLSKSGQGPRFFANAIISYQNRPGSATGDQNPKGMCSGVVSFENPSNPKSIRIWTGEHCIVLGRTQEIKVKLFFNGGYLEYPVSLPTLERDDQFRQKNSTSDAKLVGLVAQGTQEFDGSGRGFRACQEDFGRTKKERAAGVSHICYTPHDLSTFVGTITNSPSDNHTTVLTNLHKIYFESSASSVKSTAAALERLIETRNQRRIISMLKQVSRCQSQPDLCDNEGESYSHAAKSFPAFLNLAQEYYPSYLDEKILSKADYSNVSKLIALEKSTQEMETSQTSQMFERLFVDPQAPLVLFMATKYAGEKYYQGAKIPIGFNASGNKVPGLETIVQSVRVDRAKNIVVILAQKGKILDHELGDSGAILGTAPNTMGFVAMSTVDGDPTTNVGELPTLPPKLPEGQKRPEVAPVAEKKPEVVKEDPSDREGYQPTKGEPMPDHMKSISPRWPQSTSTEPEKHDSTAIESGRFYDPNQTLQASTQGSSQASPDESNQVSRDSWRQPSGESVADARVQSNETSGKGNCR
jgi:hypothetical protein